MSESVYCGIDSDDDFIKCYECETEVEVVEVCFYEKNKFCKKCYEENTELDVAQPVRMVYKKYENLSFSCCGLKNCVQIKCCGRVQGHVSLYSCDPELVNYPGLASKKKMRHIKDGIWWSSDFEETNLLRRLRLQKTERLKLVKEKEKEQLKVKKKKEGEEKAQILKEEKLTARLRRKETRESLTIGTKVAELEVEICCKLHDSNWNSHAGGGDGGLGLRLMLYENYRFKELQKTCPVIEQAGRALYNFSQPPHHQIENPFEKKDQIEKILVILEKWLEAIDPIRYCEIKGLPRPHPFDWKSLKNLNSNPFS